MAEKNEERKNVAEPKTSKFTQEQVNKFCLIAGIVVLVIVLVIYYFSRVNSAQKAERIGESYLLSTQTLSLEIKNLEEIDQILTETPNDYFILISYTRNQATYDLEKGLKPIIDNYALSDNFYYLDATKIREEDNYLATINNAFDTDMIKDLPIILYYHAGKLEDVVLREDGNPINAGDFQKLLDIYDIQGQ